MKRKTANGKTKFAAIFGVKFRYVGGIRVILAIKASMTCPLSGNTDFASRYIKGTYNTAKIRGIIL
ncbi:MAG: hypothetical protein DDT31_01709 [Syntrophomonadaceae bacterium]|nr:hypothetical protein [Bacillota bacterium]